ncbi:MAG TPA: response regulator transcription factor [Cyclobacteriaceae bacterium]|jgi:DNA-binding NarL/FixJ family response regulator|nr:response regulator transcription factor [Cyclobacteriaceae bacterium]
MTEIVIYEDNNELAEGLRLLLHVSNDFRVVGMFGNCDNIENELQRLKPQVLLMDIEMPGTDGLEGLRIAKETMGDNIKVLMLTVFEDNEKIFDALKYGADGYILKKTPPPKIVEFIKDAIDGGAPMTPSVAKKVLSSFSLPKENTSTMSLISAREQDVLNLIIEGHSYKMIGDKLFISIDTVRSHIRKIYEKLHVNSKAEAISKALRKR